MKLPQLIASVAAVLAAIPLMASAASPTEVELTKAWQSRFDAKRQAVLKDPMHNKDPLGFYRAPLTYTKVRSIGCQPQVENEIFCACDFWYMQDGKEKKDSGGIYLLKAGGGWVAKLQ